MNELQRIYSEEIQQILAKYPVDRRGSAVMPLLYLAQRQSGYIDRQAVEDIAEIIGLSTTDISAVVGFYTLYHESPRSVGYESPRSVGYESPRSVGYESPRTMGDDQPGGRYRLQVCTDLPCALRGAEEFLQTLCANLGIKVGETTPDGLFIIEEVTCLAGCHRAPLFQLQGDGEIGYHENQTAVTAMELVNELRRRAEPLRNESPRSVGKEAGDA